jgi:hypothetical protein
LILAEVDGDGVAFDGREDDHDAVEDELYNSNDLGIGRYSSDYSLQC